MVLGILDMLGPKAKEINNTIALDSSQKNINDTLKVSLYLKSKDINHYVIDMMSDKDFIDSLQSFMALDSEFLSSLKKNEDKLLYVREIFSEYIDDRIDFVKHRAPFKEKELGNSIRYIIGSDDTIYIYDTYTENYLKNNDNIGSLSVKKYGKIVIYKDKEDIICIAPYGISKKLSLNEDKKNRYISFPGEKEILEKSGLDKLFPEKTVKFMSREEFYHAVEPEVFPLDITVSHDQ